MKVTITDTNDNSPIFNPSFTQASILESSAIDTVGAVVFATDADSGINAEITFEITGGNIDDAFKIPDSSVSEGRECNTRIHVTYLNRKERLKLLKVLTGRLCPFIDWLLLLKMVPRGHSSEQ